MTHSERRESARSASLSARETRRLQLRKRVRDFRFCARASRKLPTPSEAKLVSPSRTKRVSACRLRLARGSLLVRLAFASASACASARTRDFRFSPPTFLLPLARVSIEQNFSLSHSLTGRAEVERATWPLQRGSKIKAAKEGGRMRSRQSSAQISRQIDALSRSNEANERKFSHQPK